MAEQEHFSAVTADTATSFVETQDAAAAAAAKAAAAAAATYAAAIA